MRASSGQGSEELLRLGHPLTVAHRLPGYVPWMKLSPSALIGLFVLGAAAALIGDHAHVVTGTTEYFTSAVPFIWSSPLWFPAP